jgi:hypothetical protein
VRQPTNVVVVVVVVVVCFPPFGVSGVEFIFVFALFVRQASNSCFNALFVRQASDS